MHVLRSVRANTVPKKGSPAAHIPCDMTGGHSGARAALFGFTLWACGRVHACPPLPSCCACLGGGAPSCWTPATHARYCSGRARIIRLCSQKAPPPTGTCVAVPLLPSDARASATGGGHDWRPMDEKQDRAGFEQHRGEGECGPCPRVPRDTAALRQRNEVPQPGESSDATLSRLSCNGQLVCTARM